MHSRYWHKLTVRAKEAAIAWHVKLTSGAASDSDYEAFSEWLSSDAENFTAYAHVEELSARLDAVGDVDASALDHFLEVERGNAGRRTHVIISLSRAEKFVAAIAATLVMIVGASYYLQFGPKTEHMSFTAPATELRDIVLSDGSAITLGPGAAVEARFGRKSRRITSLRGNVFFDVESNHKRPFTIVFGTGEIRVVGTRFEVNSFENRQSVAVAEGAVVVRNLAVSPDAATHIDQTNLFPGDRLTISDAAPGIEISKAIVDEVGAWRTGYFEFADAGMNEIVDRLNGFYGQSIFSTDDDALAAVRFSGILKLSDPSGTARHLSELMPVEATATDDGVTLSLKLAGE